MTVCSGYHVSPCCREHNARAVLSSLLWPCAPLVQRIFTATPHPLNPARNTGKVLDQVSKQEEGSALCEHSKGYCIGNWTGRTFLDIGMQTAGPQMRTCLAAGKKNKKKREESASTHMHFAARYQPQGNCVGQVGSGQYRVRAATARGKMGRGR